MIAPYRSQAKAVAWRYFQEFAQSVTQSKNEQELTITLINGSQIRLYGADNADSCAASVSAGVYMDEYGDFRPTCSGTSYVPPFRTNKAGPCLVVRHKGKNQFREIYETAQRVASRMVPAAPTSLIQRAYSLAANSAAAQAQLAEDQYLQEYETSFEAAILSAFTARKCARRRTKGVSAMCRTIRTCRPIPHGI
jgi:hypothetical protein